MVCACMCVCVCVCVNCTIMEAVAATGNVTMAAAEKKLIEYAHQCKNLPIDHAMSFFSMFHRNPAPADVACFCFVLPCLLNV